MERHLNTYMDPHLNRSTYGRCLSIKNLVQRVFLTVCRRLSKLNGRSIEVYFEDENIPSYVINFFQDYERELIESGRFGSFETKLSFKFLKTCCGLKNHRDKIWTHNGDSAKKMDTYEYLIAYCWNEYEENLQETLSVPDNILNYHLDKVLEALLLLIQKVEKEKNVTEIPLKSEIKRHIEKDFDSSDMCSSLQHMYLILSEHLVHQVFAMVYNHLNHLKGMPLSTFLNKNKINLVPRTGFSNVRKFLQGNPPPEKMPVTMLYRVIKRVCFPFVMRGTNPRESLLEILHNLRDEYKIPPKTEEGCSSKCHKLFGMLETAFVKLREKSGKEMKVIIGRLAKETFTVEHIQEPFELPDSSTSIKSDDSPLKSSASITTPSLVSSPSTKTTELTIDEVNICLLHKVLCPGGLTSDTLALVFKALKGNPTNIEKKKNWINFFKGDEREFLSDLKDNPNSMHEKIAKKDITFLVKLIRYGCSLLSGEDGDWSIRSNKKDTVEYNIAVIKMMRNTLAHELNSIGTEDLEKKLRVVQDSLNTILEKVKEMLEEDEKDMIAETKKFQDDMEEEMQKVYKISQHLSVNKVWKELNKMRDSVIETAQEELKQPHLYGESMQNMSPITDSTDSRHKALTIEKVFMERQLEDKDNINAGVKAIYKLEDILFYHDPLGSYRVFIIHGRPGDGKTSICKYLFHLWSQNIQASSEKGEELLFYIPCRYVTVKSLSAYLKGKLPKAFGKIKSEDVIPILQEPQVLFVVDGYDEAGEEAKIVIDEILTLLPDSKMIITTKTQWAPKIINKVHRVTLNFKVLSIAQMTKEMYEQYVKKLFNAMEQNTEDYNNFLRDLDEMKENVIACNPVPLIYVLLALVWIEQPKDTKKIRTLAELYHKLTGLIIQRVSKQLHLGNTFNLKEWMKKLGEIAWDNLKKKRHYLNENDQSSLHKEARQLDLGSEGYDHMMSGLLYCEIHENLVTDHKQKWIFTVTSQQEYFAAEYIFNEVFVKKDSYLRDILEITLSNENGRKKLQRLIPIIEMICGLLVTHDEVSERNVKSIVTIMELKEPWVFISLHNMFRYLIEENQEAKSVVQNMFKDKKISIIQNHNPQSLLWVLDNTLLTVDKDVLVRVIVNDLPQIVPILDYLLNKSCKIKVIVDVEKVSNISEMTKLMEIERYKDIRFFIAAWKPLSISELITSWNFKKPLPLALCPEVFPLLWWKILLCLLAMDKKVSKVACCPFYTLNMGLIQKGAEKLKADLIQDPILNVAEIVIHV